MTPWSVPTQSRPWQIRRLVTHRCFWPAEREAGMSSTPSLGDGSGCWGPPQGEEAAQFGLLLRDKQEAGRGVVKTQGLEVCPLGPQPEHPHTQPPV